MPAARLVQMASARDPRVNSGAIRVDVSRMSLHNKGKPKRVGLDEGRMCVEFVPSLSAGAYTHYGF